MRLHLFPLIVGEERELVFEATRDLTTGPHPNMASVPRDHSRGTLACSRD